jgi:hypothetical protein
MPDLLRVSYLIVLGSFNGKAVPPFLSQRIHQLPSVHY